MVLFSDYNHVNSPTLKFIDLFCCHLQNLKVEFQKYELRILIVRQNKMKTGHIIAEVHLAAGPNARHFGQEPRESFPTILTVGRESFSSQVLLDGTSLVKPGAIIEVQFRFLVPGNALQKITLGTKFDIWELETVGTGKVIEMISAEQPAPPDRR